MYVSDLKKNREVKKIPIFTKSFYNCWSNSDIPTLFTDSGEFQHSKFVEKFNESSKLTK